MNRSQRASPSPCLRVQLIPGNTAHPVFSVCPFATAASLRTACLEGCWARWEYLQISPLSHLLRLSELFQTCGTRKDHEVCSGSIYVQLKISDIIMKLVPGHERCIFFVWLIVFFRHKVLPTMDTCKLSVLQFRLSVLQSNRQNCFRRCW